MYVYIRIFIWYIIVCILHVIYVYIYIYCVCSYDIHMSSVMSTARPADSTTKSSWVTQRDHARAIH